MYTTSKQTQAVASHDSCIENNQLTAEILSCLALTKTAENTYVGSSYDFVGKRIFGGQLLGQALMAASHTTDRPAQSLHAYFILAGNTKKDVTYEVTELRTGTAMHTRQVHAKQDGDIIFSCMISFAPFAQDTGFQYTNASPDYPQPQDLVDEHTLRVGFANKLAKLQPNTPTQLLERIARKRHIEVKPVTVRNELAPKPQSAKQAHWLRTYELGTDVPVIQPKDYRMHQAIFAFMSDYFLLGSSAYPQGVGFLSHANLQAASLDHSIHFHKPIDVTHWLLHDMQCSRTCNNRGLNHGQIWQNGKHVATTQQEGLIRLRG